jgi:hypothetical protein
VIEQAIYASGGAGGYRFLARSTGFRDEWQSEAERLCTGFGERPAGVACPAAVFARPMGPAHVVVVQVADQGTDDAGRPGVLGFRLLVVPRLLYRDLGGDPFLIADHFPPPWHVRGHMPAAEWTAGAPPARGVEELRRMLDVPHSATLLGGVQALLDGGKLVFERPIPDDKLVRSLWALLPTGDRADLWPATFCFSNAHRFHVLVVPRAAGPDLEQYIPEEQAGDYPEGRYELALQLAVEGGDQGDLDRLLARRSRAQTMRLLVVLLVVSVVVAFVTAYVPGPAPAPPPQPAARRGGLVLPPARECPGLSAAERDALAGRIAALARRLGVGGPVGAAEKELGAALAALDRRLGTPDPRRDPGPLAALGPLQRQVRALLWKHDVPDYDRRGLNTAELMDRLDKRLQGQAVFKEERGG